MKTIPSIVFAVAVLASSASTAFAQEAKKHAAGFITDTEGECHLINPSLESARVKLGMFVYERDTIKTARRSSVKMVFSNGVEARIRQNSELSIMEVPPAERGMSSRVRMVVGGLFSRVIKQKTKFNVHTPVVTIAVRGTEFDTDVAAGNGATEVRVFKGVVALENDYGSRELKANTKSTVGAGEPPAPPAPLSSEDKRPEDAAAVFFLNIEMKSLDIAEGDVASAVVVVKDADGFAAKNFKNKISLNVSDPALLSRAGQNKWSSSVEESLIGGELKFDIKSAAPGPARLVAAAKGAQPVSVDINILRPKERTLRINLKEGSSEREIKIKLKNK